MVPNSGSPFWFDELFWRANLIWFLSINSSIVGRIFRRSVKRIQFLCTSLSLFVKRAFFMPYRKNWNMRSVPSYLEFLEHSLTNRGYNDPSFWNFLTFNRKLYFFWIGNNHKNWKIKNLRLLIANVTLLKPNKRFKQRLNSSFFISAEQF